MKSQLLFGLSLLAQTTSGAPHISDYSQELIHAFAETTNTLLREAHPSHDHNTMTIDRDSLDSIKWKSYMSKGIMSVIGGKSPISFDRQYVHDEILTIFSQFYHIHGRQVIFLQPTPQDKITNATTLETVRKHIKSDAGRSSFILTPRMFHNFIVSKADKFYHAMIESHQLIYKGGKKQFIADYLALWH